MKQSRTVLGLGAVAGFAFTVLGASAAESQSGPAEPPPATFTGTQYVDSQGCAFVRGDLDGATIWVPRMTSDRTPVCDLPPSIAVQPVAATATGSELGVEIEAAETTGTDEPALVPVASPLPTQPSASTVVESSAPVPTAPVPVPTRTAPSPRIAATTTSGPARVLPRHVYDQRQNTLNFSVPSGYRAVWDDGRLNPRRTERTLKPAQVASPQIPSGYRPAWDDQRLNPNRGNASSVSGGAQSDRIWTQTVPRTLVPVPTDRPIIVIRYEDIPDRR